MGKISGLIRQWCCLPIKGYQYLISPCLMPCCRFFPSCSEYALQAIVTHGVLKGLFLSCRRLLKCHPWSKGGHDPVLPIEENCNGY